MRERREIKCGENSAGMTLLEHKRLEKENKNLREQNEILKERILEVYYKNNGVYGAPKIRKEILKLNLGFAVSIRRIGRIMRFLGLRSVVIKKYRPHKTDSVYTGGKNLSNRDFTATKPNQKWVSDITYIHTVNDGWLYLATKKIIGWSMSKNINT